MAVRTAIAIASFVFVSIFSSQFKLSACQIVKGNLSCLDCGKDFDFSGIKILMRCDGGRKPAKTVTTDADGGFQAELPGGEKSSGNCLVKILGGPEQIYAQRRDMISKMVMSKTEPNTLTTSKPLTFSLSCPKPVGKSDAGSLIGSSKAANDTGSDGGIGMGFPPASDFFPFLPIIGIP